jgi:hypothetical protein
LYHAGKREQRDFLSPDKIVFAACGIPIKNKEIPFYVNETFYSALERWYTTKLWGLANGYIGWANEPSDYIDAITTIESEKNAVEVEEMEKKMKPKTESTSK